MSLHAQHLFPAFQPLASRFLTAVSFNAPLYLCARLSHQRLLTRAGLVHALFLGVALYTALGLPGYALCFSFLVLGSAATRIGRAEKEAAGIAEKRGGARGPENLWGAAGAATICALLAIWGGGWVKGAAEVAYVAAIATKMGDTLSSEIGKAYGGDTYLLTNFRKVPRGTEGGVSVEGTVAGVAGSVVAAAMGAAGGLLGGVHVGAGVAIVVVAAFVGNTVESLIGADLQGRLEWSNEFVNFVNTSVGAGVALVLSVVVGCCGLR